MEAKCYLIRQKALETKECLNTYNGITVVLHSNKYIAFKNLSKGNEVISFPIAGSINIEGNVTQSSMSGILADDIVDISHETFEVVILKPDLIEN